MIFYQGKFFIIYDFGNIGPQGAVGQLTDKIKFMWHGGINEASWEKIIGYEKDGTDDLTGTFFMYRNTGKQIEIWANHEDNGGYEGIIKGNIDKKKIGI